MAICTETLLINDREFIKTYSDSGMMIHGGFPESDYTEAIDPINSGRTYIETEIPVDEKTEMKEIVDILTGNNHD